MERKGKKERKKGKGEGGRSSGKGRDEGNRRTERGEIGKREGRTHTRKHKDTQMKTDAHRCTRIERKIYRQVRTSVSYTHLTLPTKRIV